MRRRVGGIVIVAVLTLSAAPASSRAQGTAVSVQVSSTPASAPLAPGFTGVSVEFSALHAYTGRDPNAINPLLVSLLRGLAPGQSPVIRIGGNSADHTWWPIRGVIPPGGITYRLTKGWLRTTQSLAAQLGAQLIVGVNLATARSALAAGEARAILAGIGRQYIQALEIGNEPDLYGEFVWYRDRHGHAFSARPRSWNIRAFIRDFSHWRAALPSGPVAGPAFSGLTWMSHLNQFLDAEPGLREITFHRYPLRACEHNRAKPGYPTIPRLLADSASAGVAQQVAPYVSLAHSRGVPFRLDEMQSVACKGKRGVSNTFAAALWALDTLFNLAAAGVDGVNVHTLPGAAYELFSFHHSRSGWSAVVHPEYYGMSTFALADPAGAHLLSLSTPPPPGPLKAWADDLDGRVRTTLINKSTHAYQVQLKLPGFPSNATIQTLSALSLSATSGVTFSSPTPVAPSVGGTYSFEVPPASAVLLTK